MQSSEEVFKTMEAGDWDKSKDMISSITWTPADPEKKYGETLLIKAARRGKEDVVRLLLDTGAAIEATDSDYGFTPLIAAAYHDRCEVVALLVDRGANINAQDNYDGWSAMMWSVHWGCIRGQVAMVKLLCSKGADLNIKDRHGNTALSLAGYSSISSTMGGAQKEILAAILEEAEWHTAKNFVVFLHTGGLSSADWSVRRLGGGGSMPTTSSPVTTAHPQYILSSGFTGRSRQHNVLENRDLCRIVSCYIPKYLDRL